LSAKTILLVEDNEDDVALALRAIDLNRVANPVVVVRDGEEARDWIFGVGTYAGRDASDTPALILLDLKLPKIDGLNILRRIRADDRTRLVPVVILTSSVHEEDLIRGYGLGANSYVRKPVNFEQFLAAVRELAMYWLLLNQPPPTPELPPSEGTRKGERAA
jgi:two-component system, response regulator